MYAAAKEEAIFCCFVEFLQHWEQKERVELEATVR